MVRWRYCLVLAVLLILPLRTATEEDDDEDPEDENDDNDNEENEEEEPTEKTDPTERPAFAEKPLKLTISPPIVTRTFLKRPLECYVCAYKAEMQQRSCLDPTKHRVHTMTCHNVEEKCFTSMKSKGDHYEVIVRGCRSGCANSADTSCCEMNRCNNQAFTMPVIAQRALTGPAVTITSKAIKAIPQSVLFFVTVLLVLQTVVKVTVV